MYVKCMCECLKKKRFFKWVISCLFPSIEKCFTFTHQKNRFFSPLRSNVCFSSQRRFTKRSTSTGFVLDYSIFFFYFSSLSLNALLDSIESKRNFFAKFLEFFVNIRKWCSGSFNCVSSVKTVLCKRMTH